LNVKVEIALADILGLFMYNAISLGSASMARLSTTTTHGAVLGLHHFKGGSAKGHAPHPSDH
jgi:hypothetical protein